MLANSHRMEGKKGGVCPLAVGNTRFRWAFYNLYMFMVIWFSSAFLTIYATAGVVIVSTDYPFRLNWNILPINECLKMWLTMVLTSPTLPFFPEAGHKILMWQVPSLYLEKSILIFEDKGTPRRILTGLAQFPPIYYNYLMFLNMSYSSSIIYSSSNLA